MAQRSGRLRKKQNLGRGSTSVLRENHDETTEVEPIPRARDTRGSRGEGGGKGEGKGVAKNFVLKNNIQKKAWNKLSGSIKTRVGSTLISCRIQSGPKAHNKPGALNFRAWSRKKHKFTTTLTSSFLSTGSCKNVAVTPCSMVALIALLLPHRPTMVVRRQTR